MSTQTLPALSSVESPKNFVRKYIFSTDHKIIGIQYFLLALLAVTIGIVLSLLMRFHLVWPGAHLPFVRGGIMAPEQYLAMVTMHGTIMVFFVLTIAPQNGFGNYFLPIQIGAPGMAFPRLNMLSFWLTFVSFLCLIAAFLVPGGAPISGWTGYPPLSALGAIAGPGEGTGQTLWIASIALFCLASLLSAINFIATTIDMRAPGMDLFRMPLTVWSWFVTAILTLLAFGVLLAAGILLLLDRTAGTSFYVPAGIVISEHLQTHAGGSPLLWQHLFWFFGHTEVYIAILPGMGLVSHVLSCFSRKPVFGYRAMALAISAIGFLGFLVWGHHMFVSGMSPYSALAFSVITMSIGVPSAVETFNWLATLWGGKIQFTTPMLFSLGFVSFFVTGGLSGMFLAQPALDNVLHATYFVVAHFHLVMAVAAIFGVFAATYFWFPKMFGRMMNEPLGSIHFWITFVGAYCIFMPMHFVGIAGGIRRFADYTGATYLAALQPLHRFSAVAAFITGAAQLIFLFNFFWCLKKGKKAPVNPWNATTLEWITTSPPPPDNFGGSFPSVYRGPYEYSVPGAQEDFVPQNLAPESVAQEHRAASPSRASSVGKNDNWDTGTVPQRTYVTGMTVALGGILMFFMALTSAFIVRKGMPNGGWRPFDVPHISWFSTLILVASSFVLARARKHIVTGDEREFRRWWTTGAILGILFLAGQAIASQQLIAQSIFLWTNPSASFFYILTAAHGLLLICGIIALLGVVGRAPRILTLGMATEVVSMYWHFMVGLWVFLFLLFMLGQ